MTKYAKHGRPLAAEHGYDMVRINDWAREQTEAHRKQDFKTIPVEDG